MPTTPQPTAVPKGRSANPLCTVCELSRLCSPTSQQTGVCWRCRQTVIAREHMVLAERTFAIDRVRAAMVLSLAPDMLALLKEACEALPDCELWHRIDSTVKLAEGEWVGSEAVPVPLVSVE